MENQKEHTHEHPRKGWKYIHVSVPVGYCGEDFLDGVALKMVDIAKARAIIESAGSITGWVKTKDELPCKVGEQVDILMWSPHWATWQHGMCTVWEDEVDWACYDASNDKFFDFDEPEYWMLIETPIG
jgi:hypothetical protein